MVHEIFFYLSLFFFRAHKNVNRVHSPKPGVFKATEWSSCVLPAGRYTVLLAVSFPKWEHSRCSQAPALCYMWEITTLGSVSPWSDFFSSLCENNLSLPFFLKIVFYFFQGKNLILLTRNTKILEFNTKLHWLEQMWSVQLSTLLVKNILASCNSCISSPSY